MTLLLKNIFSLLLLASLFLSACDKPEDKAASHIERGNALAAQGDAVKARLEYKNALQLIPTDAEARYRLGLLDEGNGDFRNAYANYTQAQQQNGNHIGARLKLAQYMIAGEQVDNARAHLNVVFAQVPDHPEAHALLGGILLRQKKYEEAEKEARAALTKEPGNTTATSVLTGLYKAMGDMEKAAAAVEDGIARNPGDISLLLLKAALFEQAGNMEKVAEAYEAIFKLKPKEAAYRLALGTAYLKAKMIDKAEATLRDTLKDFPERLDIRRHFVDFLNRERGLDIAEKEINAFLEARPDLNDPYFWLADLYMARKDVDRAAALLEKIVVKAAQTPASLNASASLARIHFSKGDRELAKKLVDTILEKNAAHPEALYVRASLYFEEGAQQNAITDLRAIIRDTPKTVNAYQLLSEILLMQGRIDLATDMLGKLLDHHPDNAPARVRLAQLFEASGKAKFGLEHLALVTKTSPDYAIGWESTARLAISARQWTLAQSAIDTLKTLPEQAPTALFLSGQLFAAQGKMAEALAAYQTIVKEAPTTPLAEHALGALAALYERDGKPQALIQLMEPLANKSPFTLTMLGEAYVRAGQREAAGASFDKAIEAGARHPKPYLGRAFLHVQDKAPEKALEILRKGQALLPADFSLPLMAADIYGDTGKVDEAIATYEGVLARNPDVPIAANNLAQLIADHKANDQALLEKARMLAERFISSPNPLLLDTLAWVYFRQGKLDQARTIMDRAMAMESAGKPLPPQMHYHYGVLLAKMGDKPRAKATLEKALAADKPFEGRPAAQELLKGL